MVELGELFLFRRGPRHVGAIEHSHRRGSPAAAITSVLGRRESIGVGHPGGGKGLESVGPARTGLPFLSSDNDVCTLSSVAASPLFRCTTDSSAFRLLESPDGAVRYSASGDYVSLESKEKERETTGPWRYRSLCGQDDGSILS